MLAQTAAFATPEIVWSSFAPEIVLVAAALVLMMFSVAREARLLVAVPAGLVGLGVGTWLVVTGLVFPGAISIVLGAAVIALPIAFADQSRLIRPWIAGVAAAGALGLTVWQYIDRIAPDGGPAVGTLTMAGSVAMDGISLFTRITVLTSVILVMLIGYGYLNDRGISRPDFEPLVLLSATGMTILGAASDLITVFVSLEILSIALYIMAGMARRDRRSQEAAVKYFVMGAVASAILLYGMALLYVATGSVDMSGIGAGLRLVTAPARVGVLGLALVTVGLGFKIALVPFHSWTPDVYQGSPTNVTAFMAAATKAAGFAVVLRMYLLAFGGLRDFWIPALAVLAAVTMLYGAVVAIVQRDVKRILAYSSIAHAGYALIGVVSGSIDGLAATLWYLLTYAVTTMGAFGCVIAIERQRRGEVALVDLRGLGKTSPLLAGILTVCLLSLAGLPPTAGFAGKLVVFQAGVAAGLEWLVVIGVVSSVIAAFFYLRLMGMMFFEEPAEDAVHPVVTTGLSAGVSLAVTLVIVLGILPQTLLSVAEKAAVLAR